MKHINYTCFRMSFHKAAATLFWLWDLCSTNEIMIAIHFNKTLPTNSIQCAVYAMRELIAFNVSYMQ